MLADLEEKIEQQFPDARIHVELDGNRALIEVTSTLFEGKSRVQRQQAVYACLNEYIQSGALHAVTLRTKTPDEGGK